MIKFFRHIRLRLLTQASSDKVRKAMINESKASKYLLYAVGEIILVVIGILIAHRTPLIPEGMPTLQLS